MRNDEKPEIEYINRVFTKEDVVLKKVKEEIQNIGKQGIHIQAYEATILQFFIRSCQAQTAIEIGTLLGYSSIWIARALPDKGRLFCLEKDPDYAQKAQSFFSEAGIESKVSLLVGDAKESLLQLEDQKFDFAFIDANKSAYLDYLEWVIPRMNSGGIIVGDNTFLFGKVYSESEDTKKDKATKVMKTFNQRLAEHPEFFSMMLPTTEGMTVAQKI